MQGAFALESPCSPSEAQRIVAALGQSARQASSSLSRAPAEKICAVLDSLSANLRKSEQQLLAANRPDVEAAVARGSSSALVDRLTLTSARIEAMAHGVEVVSALPDPVGKVLAQWERPNGLVIQRVCVPLGVLGMIYESRPNVTVDAAALCLKSHNAVILRGGSESAVSARLLHGLVAQALEEHGLPASCVSMVPTTDRALVGAMLACDQFIDVMIPRGGKGLTERVLSEARMPVFAHLEGICHVYVHASADSDMARAVVLNAKMRRTGICGAAETLLVDSHWPADRASALLGDLVRAGCTLVGEERARSLHPEIGQAQDESWRTEYLDAKMNVRVVDSVQAAIDHINFYGSHHTDSIIAQDPQAVAEFLDRVESAIVMHNASTQFADGGEFGMGAEIGIATGKFHARGPVGVEQLTTYKYIVLGHGQTRPG